MRSEDMTTYRIRLDDETMEALLEQSAKAKQPPRNVLEYLVAGILKHAKASGLQLLDPGPLPPSISHH